MVAYKNHASSAHTKTPSSVHFKTKKDARKTRFHSVDTYGLSVFDNGLHTLVRAYPAYNVVRYD